MDVTNSSIPSQLKPGPGFFINRNFIFLWGGQAISGLGDTIFFFTLTLWIATVIGKNLSWAPLAISGLMISMCIPSLVFGPIAGVFVDRWDKRLTMIRMDIIRAVFIFLLIPFTGWIALPFVKGSLSVFWHLGAIYSVVFVTCICAQLFDPARFTILSAIVDEQQRARASGLEQTSQSLANIVGPILATLLLFAVGVQWALIVNALSFVVSFLAIIAVRVPTANKENGADTGQKTSLPQELGEGLLFYRESQWMMALFISILTVTLGTGALETLLIFFYKQNLHAPIDLFGLLAMSIGLGSFLGALLATFFASRLGLVRVFCLSLYLVGILFVLFARQTSLLPALILHFLIGIPLVTLNVALSPLLMRIIPQNIMGRVMGVFSTSLTICNLISMSVAGLLGTLLAGLHMKVLGITFGIYDTIYVVAGLLFFLSGLYAMINLRDLHTNERLKKVR